MSRNITIYSTVGATKTINSDSKNWGELKAHIKNEYDLSNLVATESVNKSNLTSEQDNLPEGDFTLFLRQEKFKAGSKDDIDECVKKISKLLGKKSKDELSIIDLLKYLTRNEEDDELEFSEIFDNEESEHHFVKKATQIMNEEMESGNKMFHEFSEAFEKRFSEVDVECVKVKSRFLHNSDSSVQRIEVKFIFEKDYNEEDESSVFSDLKEFLNRKKSNQD